MRKKVLQKSAEERIIASIRDYPRCKDGLTTGESAFADADEKLCTAVESALLIVPDDIRDSVFDNIVFRSSYLGSEDAPRKRKAKQAFILAAGLNLGVISKRDLI